MNTKALKQKILDLAIHGKLLPLEKVEYAMEQHIAGNAIKFLIKP